MYKLFLICGLAVLMMAPITVLADPPPAHGIYAAGWAMNPTNWNSYTGSYSSWGLYDPNYVGGGDSWVVGGWDGSLEYIDYAPITLELWVEMYCAQSYHYTSYQWHRLGDQAETITFTIEGTVQSNNGEYVSLTHDVDDLGYLHFQHSIFGNGTAADIEIDWQAQWGTGLVYGDNVVEGWATVTPDPDLTILIPDPCDHWFQFEGTFEIPYHIPDGYYSLTMAGCPAPTL